MGSPPRKNNYRQQALGGISAGSKRFLGTAGQPEKKWYAARFCAIFLLALAALLTSGCVTLNDPETSQEYRAEIVAVPAAGDLLGQTFVSRRPNLSEIQLWLRLGGDNADHNGEVIVEIFHRPGTTTEEPLRRLSISYTQISSSFPITIQFPTIADPAGSSYYVTLRPNGGPLQAFGRSEDAYPSGQAWLNGEPLEADLSFRASYDYDAGAVLQDLVNMARLLPTWLIFGLVLWLPGWLVVEASGIAQRLKTGERAALSVGLSLAVIPVVMTWTSWLGLRWTLTGVWIVFGGLFALAIGIAIRKTLNDRGQPTGPQAVTEPNHGYSLHGRAYPLLLGFVFLVGLYTRMAMVRDLAGPAWVDPVHHGMITNLILSGGGYPDSYAPYLDIQTAQYHAGFHSVLAVLIWLSGLPVEQALLLYGQVLNALSALAVYLFTTVLLREPFDRASLPASTTTLAGILAAGSALFLSPMPAYYTSWGRYTQLAGLIIFPAALFLILKAAQPASRSARVRLVLSAGIACGGLFLTHYRVAAFLALLLAAIFTVRLFFTAILPRLSWQAALGAWLGGLGATGVMAFLLTLPWWPATFQTLLIPKLAWRTGSARLFGDFAWTFLTSASGEYLLALAGLGLLWALLQRRGFGVILVIWTGLLFFAANLGVWHLPGASFINNLSVEIALFMPLAALTGYLLAWVIGGWATVLPKRAQPVFNLAILGAGALISIAGIRSLLPILNPSTILLRNADLPALAWAREHIPRGETVLVNPFNWGYGLFAGNDGGYWLNVSGEHPTLPPPVLYGLNNEIGRAQAVTAQSKQVLDLGGNPQELNVLMQERDIHWVFIGRRGGALSPQALLGSEFFIPRYAQDGVWIFERRTN